MKRKVIVEIEYPDNFDGVWDHDKSGMQTFSDTFNLYALAHCVDALGMAIERCRDESKITEADRQSDPYYQYVMVKNEVVNTAVIYGFVDDDGNVMHFDRDKYEFVNESSNETETLLYKALNLAKDMMLANGLDLPHTMEIVNEAISAYDTKVEANNAE